MFRPHTLGLQQMSAFRNTFQQTKKCQQVLLRLLKIYTSIILYLLQPEKLYFLQTIKQRDQLQCILFYISSGLNLEVAVFQLIHSFELPTQIQLTVTCYNDIKQRKSGISNSGLLLLRSLWTPRLDRSLGLLLYYVVVIVMTSVGKRGYIRKRQICWR